jgi:hypothetical protein
MIKCQNKEELIKKYENFLITEHGLEKDIAKIMTTKFNKCKYVPHIYRGGWVIPGFGFSIERKEILKEKESGNPYLVEANCF